MKLVAFWRDRRTSVVPRGMLRVLLLLGTMAGVALLARVADQGGRLVYQHAAGVAAAPPGPR